jgi:hypothetical protein
VGETRRGRCWACYNRWAELRPVGKGASCVLCAERRRANLRMLEVHGRSLPFCHNCAAQALKLVPLPYSIEALRSALVRNRRRVDRRTGALDSRVFPRERRVHDRREPFLIDDGCHAISADDLVELDIDESDIIEVTMVGYPAPIPPPHPAVG